MLDTLKEIKYSINTMKLKQTKSMKELVAAVKKHAEDHYNDGGWDVIVECWTDQELCAHIMQSKAHTVDQAITSFEIPVSVWSERQSDAAFHRREAVGD